MPYMAFLVCLKSVKNKNTVLYDSEGDIVTQQLKNRLKNYHYARMCISFVFVKQATTVRYFKVD